MSATRRFPPPWTVRELESAFAVADANGQAVAYVYFRRDANEARQAGVLLWDEARRIARGITRLPELMAAREVEPMPDGPEGMIAWGRRNIQGGE